MRKTIISIAAAAVMAGMIFAGCAGTGGGGSEGTESSYSENPADESLFTGEETEKYALGAVIKAQREADAEITEAMEDPEYTLEAPYVKIDPYEIAPMSAVIVFSTEEETAVNVNINDRYFTTAEAGTVHSIPVYGLYSGFENKVILTTENGESSTVTIPMGEYDGKVIDVKKTYEEETGEFYMVSPDYDNTSVYDKDGRLLWYLDTGDNEGAIVFLDNGHFLISDPYQGTGGIRINYSGFLEMDFTGKIYRQYIPEYGYHHEIMLIDNGNKILISGNDESSPFMQGVVYVIDAATARTVKKMDVYEILHSVAPEWAEELTKDGRLNLVLNGFDIDEETGDVVVSLRTTGMLAKMNIDTQELKWIFADPEDMPEEFEPFLLKPVDDTRYAKSSHCPVFMEDGMLAYHNNDVDMRKDGSDLKEYEGRYSSTEILKIDEENMTVQTVWTFDDDKKVLSKMSGSLEFLDDGHKLISYGSALKPEAWENIETAQIMDSEYITGLMKELDENDEVIWEAEFGSVMHKVYKNRFYQETTPNFVPEAYVKIDGQVYDEHCGETVDISGIYDELKEAGKLDGSVDVFINRMIVETEFETSDEVRVLFAAGSEEGYEFVYKAAGEDLPIVNSGRYGRQITIPEGRYKIYVIINGTYYDADTVMVFE